MAKPPKQKPPAEPPSRESLSTRKGLEAWLRTQPQEVCVAIAARAALRVLPLYYFYGRSSSSRYIADLRSALFRAAALAWAEGKYPTFAMGFSAAFKAVTSATDAPLHDDAAAGDDIHIAINAAAAAPAILKVGNFRDSRISKSLIELNRYAV